MRRARLSTRLTLGYVALAALDSWLAGSQHRYAELARRLTKPALMPVLAACLATDARARTSPLRTSTLVAEGFGWAGDVLLLGEGTSRFAAGAGAFGLGHLAYVAGMRGCRDREQSLRHTGMGRTAAVLFGAGGSAMAWRAAGVQRELGPAVLGYTAVLAALLAHGANLHSAIHPRARHLTLEGAALFIVSDTLLGARKFWWPEAPARTESLVMVTYTMAQLLLCKAAAVAG